METEKEGKRKKKKKTVLCVRRHPETKGAGAAADDGKKFPAFLSGVHTEPPAGRPRYCSFLFVWTVAVAPPSVYPCKDPSPGLPESCFLIGPLCSELAGEG